ncbi:MAG: hypothetical protein HYZ29_14570 [Myxococcales bacterium]|nr:hypothetical protein [Myxococcales bacterium]
MTTPAPSLFPSLAPNALAEQIQDRGADVALAVYRLSKNAMVHAMDNDAVKESIARALEILAAFSREVGTAATVTFANDTIFVCGQLLRASRGVYESASELGRILAKVGVSEVSFEPHVTRDGLHAFGQALSQALRDPDRRPALLEAKITGVAVRAAEPTLVHRASSADTLPTERAVRFYATALVVMRRFYEEVAAGRRLVPHRVKRLAQQLVVLVEEKNPTLLGVAALAAAHRDTAARSVQSAILATLLTREIGAERQSLVRLATTALMMDAGRLRLASRSPSPLGELSDQDEAWVPAVTALFCVATGGINPHSAERTVTAFETTALERRHLGGAPRVAAEPLPQAEILAFVRKLVDHLAPLDARAALSPSEALDALASDRSTHRLLLQLLVRTLGLIPAGSVVELESGEWAVVVSSSARSATLPRLRVVTDARGQPLSTAVELDLGALPAERHAPRIRRVLSSRETRFNVARAFL